MARFRLLLTAASLVIAAFTAQHAAAADDPLSRLLEGRMKWESTGPLVAPVERPADPCISIKDPTIVRHDGKWHLFCTIRSEKRSHQIEYLSFGDWPDANAATRHVLSISPGYYCAPQVFYFRPHQKWYLIYQAAHPRENRITCQPSPRPARLLMPPRGRPPHSCLTTSPSMSKAGSISG